MIPSFGQHLAALALCGGDVLVRAVRIRLLVPPLGTLPFWSAVTLNAYGDAAAAVTPGRVGGDPARFLGFRRAAVPSSAALAALGVETLIDWILLAAATFTLSIVFAPTVASGTRHLVALAAGPTARLLVTLVLALTLLFTVLAWHYRWHSRPGLVQTLGQAVQRARVIGWPTVALASALTAVSMAVRTAILPVLAAGIPGLAPAAVWLGSFVLLFSQLFLPTPAGAGGVELGFAGGFAGAVGARDLAVLMLTWRVYTLIIGAGLGMVLFALRARAAWSTRRRYSTKSSVNVRPQS